MFKTLKQKIALIYLCLVAMIVIVGLASTINLYRLSKSVDKLITDNYSSINALANMQEALGKQDSALLLFNNVDRQSAVKIFSENQHAFLTWYEFEHNNITERGEKGHVENIKRYYDQYLSLFEELRSKGAEFDPRESVSFYNTRITPVFKNIKAEILEISRLNEKAMFERKVNAARETQNSMYMVMLISAVGAIGGFWGSRHFSSRLFKRLDKLASSIKEVRKGELGQEIDIASRDEIGLLAAEFNKMLSRLRDYEKSTLGKLMAERNTSLAIIRSMSEPLIILDINFKILLINRACESFFGISDRMVKKYGLPEIIDNRELISHISSVVTDKEPSKEKIIVFGGQEQDLYFNVMVTKIWEDADRRITGFVIVLHDVTQLKQLDKIKTDFIATISHEFKTPLTSILMGASLLADGGLGSLDERQKRIIDTIGEDGERLAALVNNLLQLSRLESGRELYRFENCNLNEVVEDALKPMHEKAEQNGVKLLLETRKQLPEVKADSEKITWVVNNLITNALNYTKPGDQIAVRTYLRDGEVLVSVKDSGMGIPEEYLEKIFDKFVQVKGYGIEVRGTGLGLAIVKDIITAHGGRIWCESHPNQGSNFIFSLPAPKV